MTRIIVVNHYSVLPALIGGQQAVFGLAAALAATWPTEIVWTERKAAFSRPVDAGGATLRTTAVPSRWLQRKAARALRHALGRVDPEIGAMCFAAGNRRLVEHLLAASADGDVFVLAHPWLWPALRRVLERRRALLVYDAHNVEHVLKRESLAPGRAAAWAVARVERLERELVQRADLTLACTPLDAAALAALAGVPAARLLVGAKGIARSPAADAAAAQRALRPAGRVAVFVGSDHPPNNAAARWIVETLAPARADWQFVVAGTCGPASGASARTPNVRLPGRVDDLGALLAAADVALNPVTEGSGINMKVLDYQQHALPVLCTPFGARGFEHLAANGLLVRERAGFADALAALAADPEAGRRLGRDGAACVAAHFVWDAVVERVRERIAMLLAAGSA